MLAIDHGELTAFNGRYDERGKFGPVKVLRNLMNVRRTAPADFPPLGGIDNEPQFRSSEETEPVPEKTQTAGPQIFLYLEFGTFLAPDTISRQADERASRAAAQAILLVFFHTVHVHRQIMKVSLARHDAFCFLRDDADRRFRARSQSPEKNGRDKPGRDLINRCLIAYSMRPAACASMV